MNVLVFDVNETLLDLAALDEPFQAAFGSADVRREWFQQLLRSMLVSVIVGPYVEFPRIARGALEATARRHGRTLEDAQAKAILSRIRELPAHPDVRPALERLRDAGFRLATLTNSTAEVAEAQLRHAGIRELFAQVLSADAVKRLKPAPEPYRMAADALGVPVADVRLAAAHAWDVAGALQAGCAAAFVGRDGALPDPVFPLPDIVGTDLASVAELIIERDARAR
ncbi:MAG: haloacid dehalogenase type II [Candidatus Limnocylindria bacterium]